MNINESHQLGVSCDTEDAEGSRRVSGGPAQGVITVGVFSLLGRELILPMVGAVLTIASAILSMIRSWFAIESPEGPRQWQARDDRDRS